MPNKHQMTQETVDVRNAILKLAMNRCSVADIAEHITTLDNNNIYRHIKALIANGYIKKDGYKKSEKRGNVNAFKTIIPELKPIDLCNYDNGSPTTLGAKRYMLTDKQHWVREKVKSGKTWVSGSTLSGAF